MSASEDLKKWFDNRSSSEKREVLEFLYAGKVLMTEGMYIGPRPDMVQRGLFLGPAPTSSSSPAKCPTCGRPY